MYNHDNIYETIEQYLEGTLAATERELFEKLLATDTDLQQKLLVCQSAQELIVQHKLKDLKSLMAEEQGRIYKKDTYKKIGIVLFGATLLATGVGVYLQDAATAPREAPKKEVPVPSKDGSTVSPKEVVAQKETWVLRNSSVPVKPVDSKGHVVPETKDVTREKPSLGLDHTVGTKNNSNDISAKSDAAAPVVESSSAGRMHQEVVGGKPDICKEVFIKGALDTFNPCKEGHGGSIKLRGLTGGLAPYSIHLNDRNMGNALVFEDLKEGYYAVRVVDAHGCKHDFNPVILKSVYCKLDYDFNPNRGEEWGGPETTKPAKLSILDKRGTLVFSQQLRAGEACTWSGYSSTGTLLLGYFVFVLEQEDGTLTKGSITVTE